MMALDEKKWSYVSNVMVISLIDKKKKQKKNKQPVYVIHY